MLERHADMRRSAERRAVNEAMDCDMLAATAMRIMGVPIWDSARDAADCLLGMLNGSTAAGAAMERWGEFTGTRPARGKGPCEWSKACYELINLIASMRMSSIVSGGDGSYGTMGQDVGRLFGWIDRSIDELGAGGDLWVWIDGSRYYAAGAPGAGGVNGLVGIAAGVIDVCEQGFDCSVVHNALPGGGQLTVLNRWLRSAGAYLREACEEHREWWDSSDYLTEVGEADLNALVFIYERCSDRGRSA